MIKINLAAFNTRFTSIAHNDADITTGFLGYQLPRKSAENKNKFRDAILERQDFLRQHLILK